MTIKLISCVGIDYDIALLPHFIEHYSKLDIDTFHFIIHSKSQFNLNEFSNTNINLRLDKWVGKFDGVTKTNKLNKGIKNKILAIFFDKNIIFLKSIILKS